MPKITKVEAIPFRLPMTSSLKWGAASHMDVVEHVLVRVTTDAGQVGLAEATPRPTIYGETPESVQVIINKHLAPMLLNQAIESREDIIALNRKMVIIVNNHTAKGALDICLHEALALSQGQTLFTWFNSDHRRIKVSYILGMADLNSMLQEAEVVYEQGVRVFKVKVGRDFMHDMALIQALQSEFQGQEVTIYADANECFSPNKAADKLRHLTELGVLYVEEPLPVELIEARKSLRAQNILPLIADDSTFTPRDLSRELAFNTFDILNIKTARTGYTQSNYMLTLARQHEKGVMVGSQASSTLGTIRAAIFAAQAGIDYPSELSFFLKLKADIMSQPIQLTEGYLDINTLTEIELDEARLNAMAI